MRLLPGSIAESILLASTETCFFLCTCTEKQRSRQDGASSGPTRLYMTKSQFEAFVSPRLDFQHAFFATPGVAMRGMMASVASVDDIGHCEHNHIICISLLV